MAIDISKLTNAELKNLIENHKRLQAQDRPLYAEAVAELEKRTGNGLDFEKSLRIIRKFAAKRQFLSYKDLADESRADWAKVHYAINDHLGRLVDYGHRRGWPMLSAVVVNKQHVATGEMEPETLKGFIAAARDLGYAVTDERKFLKEQQEKVFEWAAKAGAREDPAI